MTSYQQSIDLLNQTHAFPQAVMIKVLGWNRNQFELRAIEAVQTHLQLTVAPECRLRHSRSRKHVSVTFEPVFDSAQQVLSLYDALRQLDDLLMLM